MKGFGHFVNRFEETVLAVLLASMTVVTFTQVIARYVFNSGWVAALELTQIMFAWLILFGISYGIKVGIHLGVDAFVRLFPRPVFRAFALFAVLCGIVYAGLLFYGSCGNPFATGKICGSGYVGKMYKIGIHTEDLEWPRWAVYSILPIGMALFAFRCAQAAGEIWRGERETLAAAHEAEELVKEHEGVLKD